MAALFPSLQFNRGSHSYLLFGSAQNAEGDNSQVEMKLSSDVEGEVGENGVGDNYNSNHKPYVARKLGRTPKNLCFLAITVLLIFIIGKRGSLKGGSGVGYTYRISYIYNDTVIVI